MSLLAANPFFFESTAAGGYSISRSVRFNSSDSAYLSRTPSTAGNRKTWTWAGWVKRAAVDTANQYIFTTSNSNASAAAYLYLTSSSLVYWDRRQAANGSIFTTNAVFRDPSAWYHIVLSVNYSASTSSDRAKLYVNGVQQSLASTTYPSTTDDSYVNSVTTHYISANGGYLNAYLADVHFIDGEALDPTSFGEFDDNGIWQPIEYTGSFGTNGFHLPFSDNSTAAALGTDTSGNGNDWTVNNLFTQSVTTLPAVAFDGSGDYLSLADSADWYATGDWTVECFVYVSKFPSVLGAIAAQWVEGGGTDRNIVLSVLASGSVIELAQNRSGTNYSVTAAITTGRWYHVAGALSGTTLRIFLDGQLIDSTTVSGTANNSTAGFGIGAYANNNYPLNGYVSNLHFVNGTALYTSNFTPPSAPITAVANTKLLCCQSSTSATAATVSPGTITANGDAFATTRSDSSASEDSLIDVPTNGTETDTGVGGEVRGNYATANPLDKGSSITLANGNLDVGSTGAAYGVARSTIGVSSGKWYFEGTVVGVSNSIGTGGTANIGLQRAAGALNNYIGVDASGWSYNFDGLKINNGTSSYGATYLSNDVIGVAFDVDAGTVTFYKNGVSQGQAFSNVTGPVFAAASTSSSGSGWYLNFGQRPFAYTAPSGFKALNTANLPAPVVTKPSEYMDVVTYQGASVQQSITSLNFSPDLVWIKNRTAGGANGYNYLVDAVRGIDTTDNYLTTNTTGAEEAYLPNLRVSSLDSNGFTLEGSYTFTNNSSYNYVAWNWDAGSSTVTNTDGSITSSVRANPSAGFSIVTYTGTGTTGTVGHGLGVAPSFIVCKSRNGTFGWAVYHQSLGRNGFLVLNSTAAFASQSNYWGTSDPSSTVVSFSADGFGGNNNSGTNYVMYAFAPVSGYSSFGSYTGNGSTDGPFVYTGFRPRWLLMKDATTGDPAYDYWFIWDTARNSFNVSGTILYPNASDAEATSSSAYIDILSNGFKVRNSFAGLNQSSQTVIYAAFAESPFQYARAR